jgi:hypothetical protein
VELVICISFDLSFSQSKSGHRYFQLAMSLLTAGTTAVGNQNGLSEAPISARKQADNADRIATHKAGGRKQNS